MEVAHHEKMSGIHFAPDASTCEHPRAELGDDTCHDCFRELAGLQTRRLYGGGDRSPASELRRVMSCVCGKSVYVDAGVAQWLRRIEQ